MLNLKFKLATVILLGLSLGACSKTGSSQVPNTAPATTAAPRTQSALPSSTTPDTSAQPGDTMGQNDQDQVKQVVPKDKAPKKDNKTNNQTVDSNKNSTTTNTTTTPTLTQSTVTTDKTEPTVTGLGSTSKKPEELLDQGFTAAIFQARFCSVSGKFTDGSQCYLVYSDGRTEYENALNSKKIQPFIDGLKAQLDAQNAQKKQKKAKKPASN